MRIFAIGTKRSGFTMIELMVVAAIIVIIIGVVTMAMQPALRDAKMHGGCRMIASALNYARSYAASSQTTARVTFSQVQGTRAQRVEIDTPIQPTVTPGSTAPSSSADNQQWIPLTTAGGRPRTLPEGIAITQIVKSDGTTDASWVDFTNQGQAESTMIVVSDQTGQNRYILVDPITGRCRILTNAPTQSQQTVH